MSVRPPWRWRVLGGAKGSVLLLAAAMGMLMDAGCRRGARTEQVCQSRAVVRLLGTADLALSTASRWLRHPSLSEPGAPFADGQAMLEVDPAGALIGPPLEVLRVGAATGTAEPLRSRGQ